MNKNLTTPAYPCTPIQDQFNRLIVPNAGINKLEYFALELYKSYINNEYQIDFVKAFKGEDADINDCIMDCAITDAITLIEKIEIHIKPTNNEKNSKLVSL